MRRIPLSVKNQSIETSGITKDYKEAICEYIWNGFEANAKNVELEWKHNQLDGGDIISIADNGDGINFNNLDNTFGTFLASQKNSLSLKAKSKANKGKGRFSFMCCASDVLWKTVYSDTETQTNYEYELSLSDSSKEFIDCSEPQPTIKGTGTIATLLNVFGFDLNDLQSEEFTNYLLTEFAWYLYLNKNTTKNNSTCKKEGAKAKFKDNIDNDPVLKKYNSEKHRILMYCNRSKLDEYDFFYDYYDWLDMFEPKIKEYKQGDLSAYELLNQLEIEANNFVPYSKDRHYTNI